MTAQFGNYYYKDHFLQPATDSVLLNEQFKQSRMLSKERRSLILNGAIKRMSSSCGTLNTTTGEHHLW